MMEPAEYSEEYYEHLARTMGEEAAAWARLSPEAREKELRWYHEHIDTPDDLADWPPELGGGVWYVCPRAADRLEANLHTPPAPASPDASLGEVS